MKSEVEPSRRKRPKTGGRKAGTPNKTTLELKTAILQALTKAGGVTYLAGMAKNNPGAFAGLLGRVLPLQVTGEGGGAVVVEITRFGSEK